MASPVKNLCSLITFFLLIAPLYGQSTIPHIQWAKSFGGSEIDQAFSIEQTSDKGFIIAGEAQSDDDDVVGHHGIAGGSDFWIVKLDSNGNLEWKRSLGGGDHDMARSIKQTADGYVIIGSSYSLNGDVTGQHGKGLTEDYWVVKIDFNGKIMWEKSLGGTNHDLGFSVDLTSDSGYIVAGTSNSSNGDVKGHHGDTTHSDFWIAKLDAPGNILWEKSFGGTEDDYCYNIRLTSDHGFIAAGSTLSSDGDVSGHHGNEDFWIIKLDSIGTLLWQKTIGGSGTDFAYSIDLTSDNGFIVAGYSNSTNGDVSGNHGQADYWVAKLDSLGNLKWQKSFGGTDNDVAYSIKQTFDKGFIIAGISASNDGDVSGNHGGNDYWIVKLDSVGNLLWQKSVGGPGEDFALSITQTSDSGYIVAGSSDFDGGDVTGNHNHEDYWIVKLGTTGKTEVSNPLVSYSKSSINYPNPFSEKTTIQLSEEAKTGSSLAIYDLLGVQLRTLNIPEGNKNLTLERNGLANGVYVYHVMTNGNIIERGRFVIE